MSNQKIAIVTGASRGIGLAISQALSQEGMKVFAVSRSDAEQGENPGIIPIKADIQSADEVERAVRIIHQQADRVDILVNNAGLEVFKPLIHTSLEEYDQLLDTNLRGAFLFTKAVLPVMIARSAGYLIFINSVSGLRGFAQDSVYCASKHALTGLAEALDEELRASGIRVTSIFPGATDTKLSQDSWSPPGDPLRPYFLKPEDVAQAVLFALRQPPHAVISQIVIRPLVEKVYSDFLPPEAAARLIPLRPPGQSEA